MTSRFTITKVGSVVLLGAAVSLAVSTAQAAEDSKEGETGVKAKASTGERPASSARASKGQLSQIGLGVGFFAEDSERRDEILTGGQSTRNQEPQELENVSIFNIQAWYLTPIWVDGLRWGGGVAWFNKYSVQEPDAEEDAEPDVYGHMFQLGLQGEYELANIASKLGLVVGLRGGAALLFPSGELRQKIQELEQQGFDVWTSPQFGAYIAPLAGVRWPLSQRVSLRSDLSVQFSKLWLYDAEAESEGFTTLQNATLSTTRIQLLIGLDFAL